MFVSTICVSDLVYDYIVIVLLNTEDFLGIYRLVLNGNSDNVGVICCMSGCSLLAIHILATRLFVHSNTDVIDHVCVFGI